MACIFQHPTLLTHDQLSLDGYLTRGVSTKGIDHAAAAGTNPPGARRCKQLLAPHAEGSGPTFTITPPHTSWSS